MEQLIELLLELKEFIIGIVNGLLLFLSIFLKLRKPFRERMFNKLYKLQNKEEKLIERLGGHVQTKKDSAEEVHPII